MLNLLRYRQTLRDVFFYDELQETGLLSHYFLSKKSGKRKMIQEKYFYPQIWFVVIPNNSRRSLTILPWGKVAEGRKGFQRATLILISSEKKNSISYSKRLYQQWVIWCLEKKSLDSGDRQIILSKISDCIFILSNIKNQPVRAD